MNTIELIAKISAAFDHMDSAGGDNCGMPECPWCHSQGTSDLEHKGDCELVAAREAVERLRAELLRLQSSDRAVQPIDIRKDCTCLGSCRGADGLGVGWKCALEKNPLLEQFDFSVAGMHLLDGPRPNYDAYDKAEWHDRGIKQGLKIARYILAEILAQPETRK